MTDFCETSGGSTHGGCRYDLRTKISSNLNVFANLNYFNLKIFFEFNNQFVAQIIFELNLVGPEFVIQIDTKADIGNSPGRELFRGGF